MSWIKCIKNKIDLNKLINYMLVHSNAYYKKKIIIKINFISKIQSPKM